MAFVANYNPDLEAPVEIPKFYLAKEVSS